ncbi:MAG: hypothetical protein J5I93_06565 [Pirellulaceae bacterium]|nr:hypothetical protein [Pirellulaceae bacterium]
MSKFDAIVSNIDDTTSLVTLSDADVARLRNNYSWIDSDYLDFLREVGYGNLGELQLYNQPTPATSVYSVNGERLQSVLLFGDDMQGHCFGFDAENDYRVVEVTPRGELDLGVEATFIGLMTAYFG